MLERTTEQVDLAANRLIESLQEKLDLWLGKTMRSRARNTYVRFLQALPRLLASLTLTLAMVFHQLRDKDSIGELGEQKLVVTTKALKQILKATENIATNVIKDRNRWEEALKHCDSLEAVILKMSDKID